MMRKSAGLAVLALLAALALVSCDQMFTTNFFASFTHEKVAATTIENSNPTEIQALLASDAIVEQIKADTTLRDAALTTLAATYDPTPGTPVTVPDPDVQKAAVVAAEVYFKTDPIAAQFSAAAIGAIGDLTATLSSDTVTAADFSPIIEGILPQSIAAEAQAGAAVPPVEFITMIETFADLNKVYYALGENLQHNTPVDTGFTDADGNIIYDTPLAASYDAAAGVANSDALATTVNAFVAAVVMNIELPLAGGPFASSAELAAALWNALVDPANAANYITFDPNVLTSAIAQNGTGYLANLAAVSGITF
jgi:hypothetical protein